MRVEDRFGAVRTVSRALLRAGVVHALGGSALRWALGLERTVRDWDVTTDADEHVVRAALAGLGATFVGPTPPFRSAYLARLALGGEVVEVIGRFALERDGRVERVATRVWGWAHGVPLADPSDWRRAYRLLGRGDAARSLAEVVEHGEDAGVVRAVRDVRVADLPALDAATWRRHADALYGPAPAAPASVTLARRASARATRLLGAPTIETHRVDVDLGGRHLAFDLQVLRPTDASGVPVVIDGDAGWWAPSDDAAEALLARGVALARFDRTALVVDEPGPEARGPLADAGVLGAAGAIAGWAWAFARAVDAALQLPWVDAARIGLSGFSRGGKAALLAAARDARVALVHAHASGAAGAALARVTPAGAERLVDVTERFPWWFAPGAAGPAADPSSLASDQHALLAAVAPRSVVLTCGLADAWANPVGTAAAVAAARPSFARRGAEGALVWHLRPGGHAVEPSDLALVATQLRG